MLRNDILAVLLGVGLLALTACGGVTNTLADSPVQPMPDSSETTSADPASPEPSTTAASEGNAARLEPLNWGATDEENCIIPGLAISGTAGVPCEPVDLDGLALDANEAESSGTDVKADDVGIVEGATTTVEPAMGNLDAQAAEMTALAVDDLSQQLGVAADEIVVMDVMSVTWPDSSMGCPEPDMMYAQMMQEGYLIRLAVDGESYYYHSGGNTPPFLCEETMQLLPPDIEKGDEMVPPPGFKLDQPDAASD